MKPLFMAVALAVSVTGIGAAPEASAQSYGWSGRHHDRDWRSGRGWDRRHGWDRRRGWERRHRWDRGRYGWRNHRRCQWVWRHHHRVRRCW
jgi:Ni/Co efflux regulator RcnB